MRTHVVLPEELVKEVDRLAGPRRRSEFIEAAVREQIRRQKQSEALRSTASILNPHDHPEWRTPEDVSRWVHESRMRDEEATRRKLQRFE